MALDLRDAGAKVERSLAEKARQAAVADATEGVAARFELPTGFRDP